MSKLYEISNEYQQILDFALYSKDLEYTKDGEVLEHNTNEVLNAELEKIKESFENKAIAVAMYIRNLEADAEAISNAILGMQERSRRFAKQANSLREYLQFNIEKTGITDKIKCPHFQISVKTNPESLVIIDESLIPDIYIKEKIVKSVDKISIKKDIQAGFEVEGTKLERNKVLVIK
jgi:hypothetical protein